MLHLLEAPVRHPERGHASRSHVEADAVLRLDVLIASPRATAEGALSSAHLADDDAGAPIGQAHSVAFRELPRVRGGASTLGPLELPHSQPAGANHLAGRRAPTGQRPERLALAARHPLLLLGSETGRIAPGQQPILRLPPPPSSRLLRHTPGVVLERRVRFRPRLSLSGRLARTTLRNDAIHKLRDLLVRQALERAEPEADRFRVRVSYFCASGVYPGHALALLRPGVSSCRSRGCAALPARVVDGCTSRLRSSLGPLVLSAPQASGAQAASLRVAILPRASPRPCRSPHAQPHPRRSGWRAPRRPCPLAAFGAGRSGPESAASGRSRAVPGARTSDVEAR